MDPRVLVDATAVPADRGGVGRYVDGLIAALGALDANPAVVGDIKWNFTKFLVDRNGKVVARFEPDVTPDSPQVIAEIEKLVKQ